MMARMWTAIGLGLAAGFAVAALVLAYALHVVIDINRAERDHARADHEREREAWRSERRELVTRATHPHLVPTGTRPATVNPDELEERRRRAAEMAAVGRIVHGSAPNGAGDDDLPGVP